MKYGIEVNVQKNHITWFSKPIKTLSQKLLSVALRHRNFCANFAFGKTVFTV